MQAFVCEVVRAFTKLGIAMAARRPMMATTIMISTRVKPDLREVLFALAFAFLFVRREQDDRRVNTILMFGPLIALCLLLISNITLLGPLVQKNPCPDFSGRSNVRQ